MTRIACEAESHTVLPFCDFCVTVVTKQVLFFVHIERRLHFRSQPKRSSETVEPSHTAHRCYNERWSSTVPPLLTVVPLYTPQCSSTQDALGFAVAMCHRCLQMDFLFRWVSRVPRSDKSHPDSTAQELGSPI